MAFDLKKAAGLDKIVPNLDTMEVVQIPLEKIDPNEKNFFSVDDVQDLVDSIQVNGILQPLLLKENGDRYTIIAGHRRHKAAGIAGLKTVPAVVQPNMSEAMEWFILIKTNTTTRELTHAEKTEAAIRMKKQLVQLKQEGAKITGRLRDIVAEQMEISKSEMARMEVIDKNLNDEFKKLWKTNSINASCAYELAKLPDADQQELLAKMARNGLRMSTDIVEDYVLQKKCKDWACRDCPYPQTPEEREKRGKGWKFPCHHLKKLQIRNWASDGQCTCCADCGKAFKCLDSCSGAKVAACEANRKKRIEEENQAAATSKAERDLENAEHFQTTPFVNIGKSVIPLVDRCGISLDDIADWWTDNVNELLPPGADEDSVPCFDGSDVANMLYAKCIEDVNWDLVSFIAFCEAVNRTPNDLLGYLSTRWKPYPAMLPVNGQRVVVRRTVGAITRCGEYIYRDGDWYEPGLDDYKMNITGVTHWIETPEA